MNTSAPHDARAALAVCALVTLVLAPGIFFGLPSAKGIGGADAILHGSVPYRDFWSMYAPGQFYAIAAVFAVLGRELVFQAAASVVLGGVSAALFFLLARRVGASLRAAILLALVFGVSLFNRAPELSSYPLALPCMLGALLALLRYFENGDRRSLVAAGLLVGCAAVFKHDVGAYLAFGSGVGLLLSGWLAGPRRPARWLAPHAACAAFAAGALAVVVPVAAWLAWKAGRTALQDLILFPATDFRAVRGESGSAWLPHWEPWSRWLATPADADAFADAVHSAALWLRCSVPQVVFAIGAGWVWLRRRALEPAELGAALLFLGCMPFYWMAAQVQKNTHLVSLALCTLALGALWLPRLQRSRRLVRAPLLGLLAVYSAALLAQPGLEMVRIARSLGDVQRVDLEGARWIHLSRRECDAYRPIAAFVQRHVPRGEPVYVGVTRHDAVVAGNQRIQYLCDRPGATRYLEQHPGIVDREEIQREMIEELERRGVRCSILWRFPWSDDVLDGIRQRRRSVLTDSGSILLDEYLRLNFESVLEVDDFTVVWRKGAPRE